MILVGAAALLLLAFGGGQAEPRAPRGTISVRHQQIIVRIPRMPPAAAARVAGVPLINWREGRGMRCVAVNSLAGATFMGENSVDLILRDNRRVRARLENRCPALDYYRGFYIDTTADGRICAGRDAIRSRAGGECQIDAFLSLFPQRP
ncbi:MAG TPA: hypothetical protein VF704_12335 [Allosphingosinicella sp.]